jgi:hypothetical protein
MRLAIGSIIQDRRRVNWICSSEIRISPTVKAGIPHLVAPQWLLERMLTIRVHLDEVTHENGPLVVQPGSHRGERADGQLEDGQLED